MASASDTSERKKRSSRIGSYLAIFVLLGLVVGAAYFQEDLRYFTSLRMWDRAAPGRAVAEFLVAGREGDQARADSYIGARDLQPLEQDGQWKGYFIITPAGQLKFTFDELAPQGTPQATHVEFRLVGPGAALVDMPDSQGNSVRYRLEMIDGRWKITEILGGRSGS